MTQWIKIGGEDRPIEFSYATAYGYESETGGNYNELIFGVVTEVEAVGAAMASNDLRAVAAAMRVKPLADLAYYGLVYGYRREKMSVDFGPADVAQWLFSDRTAMQACMTAIFESLPRADGGADTKKKEIVPGPQSGSTGRTLSKRQQQ